MLSEVVRKNGLLHNCIFESKGTFTPNRSSLLLQSEDTEKDLKSVASLRLNPVFHHPQLVHEFEGKQCQYYLNHHCTL